MTETKEQTKQEYYKLIATMEREHRAECKSYQKRLEYKDRLLLKLIYSLGDALREEEEQAEFLIKHFTQEMKVKK